MKPRECARGKPGWAADPKSSIEARKDAYQRVELILRSEGQARAGGEVRAQVEREIQVEESLEPLLSEVSAVATECAPLERAPPSGLNNCLEFVSVFPHGNRQTKLCDSALVLVELAAVDQLP